MAWHGQHPCAQPDVPAPLGSAWLDGAHPCWTSPCPPRLTRHTLSPPWTQMHVVFCMWPHVHSGHTHTVSHVAHTQTHIDTRGWLCPALHIHTQLVHLCSHARGSARSTSHVRSRSVCLCTLTCLWTVKGADPPTSRAGPGLDCRLGDSLEGSWAPALARRGWPGSAWPGGPFGPA